MSLIDPMKLISVIQQTLLLGCVASYAVAAAAPDKPRPQLQFINASDEKIEILWLSEGSKEVPNGTVDPGKNRVITTTLGHKFAVIGQQSKTRVQVECIARVQAFRFAPNEKNGIPAFYTQRIVTGGFPIVASATVNPYALKEAAYLVDQMLIKRDDVRKAMVKSGARLCIIAYNEYTTDLPEFAWFSKGKDRYPGVSA
ncbi:MAG: hypothetical protein HN759_09555, partial [Akkermansiaceae bacterium]|nr:hypothetical protein [Akkermansiaceae bacterium]